MKAEEINKHIKHFTPIYKDGKMNPIPENVKVTVWCDNGDDEQGFCYNVTKRDMGINVLIADKWMLQSDLDLLTPQTEVKDES